MSEFKLRRLGMLMEPEPGNPMEVEGVLNPAAVRGPDGELYLFPRLVAKGNYSRIGIARVRFNEAGDPAGVERLGIALEPEAEYEHRPDGSGGCEDPRVTYVEPLQRYIMSYTAFSPQGPRIAMAAIGGPLPLEASRTRQPTLIGTALNWATWMTKMRACSLSQSLTPPGNWNWVCSTVRFFRALVQRRLLAIQPLVKLTLTGRASGSPIVRRPCRAVNRIAWAVSPLITDWRLQSRPGNVSRSALEPRLS